jgi:hypothetical protein
LQLGPLGAPIQFPIFARPELLSDLGVLGLLLLALCCPFRAERRQLGPVQRST